MKEYFASGKLLLTGEYAVLKGAQALSVPTRLGQKLRVYPDKGKGALSWLAFDNKSQNWLNVNFAEDLRIIKSNDAKKAQTLQNILQVAKQLGAQMPFNCKVETYLEFDRQWGLGSSSTLIALIAQWLKVPALPLFFNSLSGSGYDVATALAKKPILYQLSDPDNAHWECVTLPSFFKDTHFMYLGQKQNSAREVARFKSRSANQNQIDKISALSKQILRAENLSELQKFITAHEAITSEIIGLEPVQTKLFPDFKGSIKSLGAWGGDFVWLIGLGQQVDYFNKLGYHQIITYNQLCRSK